MRRSGRLAGATLEVHNTDNLQFIIATAMRNIALHFGTTVLVEPMTEFLNLLDCIGTASAGKDDGINPLTFKMQFLQIARRYTKEVSRFSHGKLAQVFTRIRREVFMTQQIELARDLSPLRQYHVVKRHLLCFICDIHRLGIPSDGTGTNTV